MKVLFFTNIPSPYRVDFFNELGKQCDLTVLYERCDADDRDKSWMKADGDMHYKAVFLKGKKVGADTALCFDALQYWKDPQYDIRIVGDYTTPTGILSVLYMRLCKISYGIELDGGYMKPENRILSKVKRFLIGGSSFAFSPGKTTDRYLQKYGMHRDKIFFYPFTSLTDEDLAMRAKLEKSACREAIGVQENKMILTVGQMIPRKGIDVLLRAARMLDRDIGIYIVGGEPPEEYKKIVQEENLTNVYFIPFKNKQELALYYGAADVFVLPTREDIWGLVIEEAMSFGLPVVTTDKCVAGVELVADKGGALVPTEDADALAKVITRMLDEDTAAACGGQNLQTVATYTIENMVTHHIRVFEELKDLA